MSAVPSHVSAATCSSAARVYHRRRSERTALYWLVQQHIETWLVRRREGDPDAALIPPPRRHRHHCAGVYAPHARLRARVTICAGQPMAESVPVRVPGPDSALPVPTRRRASIRWARLLAHLGEPIAPPVLAARARGPPELETEWAGTPEFAFDQSRPWDPTTPAPDPGLTFDQTLN
jgi:hypothetical protein